MSKHWFDDFFENVSAGEVRVRLDAGANVDERDDEGVSPLYCAVDCSDPDVVRLLLDRADDPNLAANDGETPLMRALSPSDLEKAKLLVDREASFHAADNQGKTVLMYAAEDGEPEVIAWMLQQGSDRTVHDREGYSAFTHYVANLSGRKPDKGILNALRIPGEPLSLKETVCLGDSDAVASHLRSLSAPPADGPWLLLLAVHGDQHDIARLLLESGVDPNARTANGSVPLYSVQSASMVDLLVSYGADVNVGAASGDYTPLSVASDSSARTQPAFRDYTPLSVASTPEVVDALLAHGADIEQAKPVIQEDAWWRSLSTPDKIAFLKDATSQ